MHMKHTNISITYRSTKNRNSNINIFKSNVRHFRLNNISSYPILWLEETLLLPPGIPCSFNIFWAILCRQINSYLLLFTWSCWQVICGNFFLLKA